MELSKEEWKEIELGLTTILGQRQIYKLQETKEKLLKENDRYIDMDIKLIKISKQIIKMMEDK